MNFGDFLKRNEINDGIYYNEYVNYDMLNNDDEFDRFLMDYISVYWHDRARELWYDYKQYRYQDYIENYIDYSEAPLWE
jgi:hypothetical protein